MPTLLVFQLGGEPCAVRAEQVQEIVLMASLIRPAKLPAILEGFLNLRGVATPVLRLDRMWDLPRWSPGLYTPLIILRGGTQPLGLLVERADRVLSAPPSAVSPVRSGHRFGGCAEAEVRLDPAGVPLRLLAAERLLRGPDRGRVAKARAAVQQRLQERGTPG